MVNLGIVGLGKWAGILTAASQKSSVIAITQAYSRSEATRNEFSNKYNIHTVDHFEQMLENPLIDGIILTLPNELHAPYALRCAEHGKPVYIEKPITNDLKEAWQLRKVFEQKNLGLFVGHCAKLLPGVQLIAEAIQAGNLGKVSLIEGKFCNERALSLTPDNWRWYQNKAPGGPLSQIAIHQFDIMSFLGGAVKSVSAMAAKLSPVGAEVEDQWLINMDFQSGALGCVTSSWTSPGVFEVRVIGSKGLMHYQIDQTLWGNPSQLHLNSKLYFQELGKSSIHVTDLAIPKGDMFQEELELFGKMIEGEPQPWFNADFGIQVLGLVEASRQSHDNNSIRIPIQSYISKFQ